MSQHEIAIGAAYILSSNGMAPSGNDIVVSAMAEIPATMETIERQDPAVPPHHASRHNNVATSSTTPEFIGGGNAITVTTTQTSDEQSIPGAPGNPSVTIGEIEQKWNSSTEDDSSSKNMGVCWPREAVLKLISLHVDHQSLFEDSHYKKKSIWEMVSRKMKEADMNYSWAQAENKWKSLTKRYRDTNDFNAKNSNVISHTCPFYDELSQAYPYVSPHASFVVQPPCVPATTTSLLPVNNPLKRPAESVSSLSEADLATLRKKKYQNACGGVTVYSCSTPSANIVPSPAPSVDLGVLLRSIHEERTRQDKQKMDRLEKMHKEKMELFKQFLDIIKDIKK